MQDVEKGDQVAARNGDGEGEQPSPEDPEGALELKKERKVRNVWAVPFYRESEKNKLLLDEVLKQNPFAAKFGKVKAMWDSIAAALNEKETFNKSQFDQPGCQNQVKKLVDYWERRRTVQAQLQNKLSEWEMTLEKMIELTIQSEYQKNTRKTPVVSFEEELLIYNQGGSLNKRPRFELNNWGVLEATIEGTSTSTNTDIMQLLDDHSSKLHAIEELSMNLKAMQGKVLECLDEKNKLTDSQEDIKPTAA